MSRLVADAVSAETGQWSCSSSRTTYSSVTDSRPSLLTTASQPASQPGRETGRQAAGRVSGVDVWLGRSLGRSADVLPTDWTERHCLQPADSTTHKLENEWNAAPRRRHCGGAGILNGRRGTGTTAPTSPTNLGCLTRASHLLQQTMACYWRLAAAAAAAARFMTTEV